MKPLSQSSLWCLGLVLLATPALVAAPARSAASGAGASTSTSTHSSTTPTTPAAGGESTATLAKGVEVANVRFNNVNAINGGATGPWHEVDIEISVKPGVAKDDRFVNRVRVTLTLGTEVTVSGLKRVLFYRATEEAIALEVGRSDIRFYLPPEIVKRDRLNGESKYYAVEIAVEGQTLPMVGNKNYSASSIPVISSFLSKAASDASANAGVLLPQFLTPFANDSSRVAPVCVRPEAAGKN